MDRRLRTSIVGITGYTGLELLRLLVAHPRVEIACLTSRQPEAMPIGALYPHLAHLPYAVADTPLADVAKKSDVVFLCLPHKHSQEAVAELMRQGNDTLKIIDLSADYRLSSAELYEETYGLPHAFPDLLKQAVYGLPEVYRAQIKTAQLVANPGCFALLSQLLLLPFRGQMAHAHIMAITGSSGAGKSAVDGTHHPVRNHNMKSYNINAHRHMPEILQTSGLVREQLQFVPTSGPFTRGIFATAFITPDKSLTLDAEVQTTFASHPFVRLQTEVALANVVGSNYADLSFQQAEDGTIIAQGAIDNLVRGAAGTAIQNMNLMTGCDETEGLAAFVPVYP